MMEVFTAASFHIQITAIDICERKFGHLISKTASHSFCIGTFWSRPLKRSEKMVKRKAHTPWSLVVNPAKLKPQLVLAHLNTSP